MSHPSWPRRAVTATLLAGLALLGLAACGPLGSVSQVSMGEEFACARKADGTVWCWGRADSGQLGDGSRSHTAAPAVAVAGITTATSVATGTNHACAVLADGTARCWGYAVLGQTGRGIGGGTGEVSEVLPVPVDGLTGATQITAGASHTCARLSDGTARCWGRNVEGQLGNGTTTTAFAPVPVSGLTGVVSIQAGAFHTCALIDDDSVRCWGANNRGQLGNGTTTNASTPTTVTGLTGVAEVDGGGNHTCARRAAGTVACWGRNTEGELGNGGTTDATTPVNATGITAATDVTAGDFHTCAVEGGSVRCWGYGGNGRLGNGSAATATTPATVAGLTDVQTVEGGAASTCAVLTDATSRCWGYNGYGGLGDTTRTERVAPVSVAGQPLVVKEVEEIESGGIHTCLLTTDATVSCLGQGVVNGELGNGTFTNSRLPVTVPSLTGVQTIAVGAHHTCAVLADTTVRCWGRNADGQLGNGTSSTSNVPVAVTGLTGVVDLEAGTSHTCALLTDTTVRCWGANADGQLGNGTTTPSNVPVTVTGLTGVGVLGAGLAHTCATLTADGSVRCWGRNADGQLGNGTTNPATVPATVTGLTGATDVTAGTNHSCAVLTDGSGRCWGSNALGQLGTGSGSSLVPAPVSGLTNAGQITAGHSYTCATLGDAGGRCWGTNLFGQLGRGHGIDVRTQAYPVPGPVAGQTAIAHLDAGTAPATNNGQHTCARLTDGTATCWGAAGSGQLGDGGDWTDRLTTNRKVVREG